MDDVTKPKAICNLPVRRQQFRVADFAAWLAKQGAEVGIPTNPYEVIRYRAYHANSQRPLTHIVYSKDNGLLNFQGASAEHYRTFLSGKTLKGAFVSKFDPAEPVKSDRMKEGFASKMRRKLLARDGDECWFCGDPMGNDCTLEHLVPRSKGGANKADNYALAHKQCNADAGNRPLVDKIAMRERMRAEKAPQ